ncbi:hypothetical protein LCGC14_1720340, partial [marine sediment metagenome]
RQGTVAGTGASGAGIGRPGRRAAGAGAVADRLRRRQQAVRPFRRRPPGLPDQRHVGLRPGQEDLAALIAIYAEELAEYPLDVVRDACRTWARREKWFPAWADLRALCEERVMKRRDLLMALRRSDAARPRDKMRRKVLEG